VPSLGQRVNSKKMSITVLMGKLCKILDNKVCYFGTVQNVMQFGVK